jgi:integrase
MEPNVVQLNNQSVYNRIMAYINDLSSENTRKSYLKNYKEFFMFTRNKHLHDLTEDDLVFNRGEIQNYRTYLRRHKHYKGTTVNQRINSLRALFAELSLDYNFINPMIFKLKPLDTSDSETIGFFESRDEAMLFVQKAKELSNGEMKSIIFDLAIHTSGRLNALTKIKPKDIVQQDDDIWLVKIIDKGRKVRKRPITKRLANRIFDYIQKNRIKKDDYIFQISTRQIQKDIDKLCEMLNIDPERNISFHSFRKVASMYEIVENKDPKAAQLALGHSDPSTTLKWYAENNADYSQEAGITMEQEVDVSRLEQLTKEQLLMIIGQSSRSTKKELNRLAEKLW